MLTIFGFSYLINFNFYSLSHFIVLQFMYFENLCGNKQVTKTKYS